MHALNNKNKVYLLISSSFILCLLTTSISNNNLFNLAIKLLSVLLFVFLTFAKIHVEKNSIINVFREKRFTKFVFAILLILTYTGVTLFYSSNISYGYWKWLNLLLIIMPFLIFTY